MLSFNLSLLRRRLAAAARLAAFYVLGVALLVVPLEVTRDLSASRQLREFGMVFGIFFALAFTLLAVARRAGFAALWLVLLGLWIQNLKDAHSVLAIPEQFVYWSLLGFPLFVLGVLGSTGASRIVTHRWRVPASWLVLLIWMVLAGAGLQWGWLASDVHFDGAPYDAVATAAWFIWAPAPFAIGLIETARVWVATRSAKITAPAASLAFAPDERDA